MGIIIRQSLKASAASYIGVFIGTINVLFISTRFLTPEQLGLTRVLFDTGMLFASFAHLGAPLIADKFFPYFKNESREHHGFLVFLLSYALIGFLAFTATYILCKDIIMNYYRPRSPSLINYYYYIIPITFFFTYLTIIEAYSRIHARIVVPVIVREVFLKLSNTLLIIAYGFHWINFDTFLKLLTGCYGLAVALVTGYVYWLGRLYLRPDGTLLNRSFVRQMSFYGLFIIVGGVGALMAQRIDSIMLPGLKGLDFTAIYGIAFLIAQVIDIPKRAVGQISAPILAQAWANQNWAKIDEMYKKSSINQLIAGTLLFLGIWCNIDALFYLMPKGSIYNQGKQVVLLIAITRLIEMATGLNGEIITYSKYYKYATLLVLILAVLTVVTNQFFIPLYGINGAAIAYTVSFLIFIILKLCFVYWRFKLQPFTSKTLICLLITGLVYSIVQAFPAFNQSILAALAGTILRSLLITFIFIALHLWLRVSPELNQLMNIFFIKLLRYFKIR